MALFDDPNRLRFIQDPKAGQPQAGAPSSPAAPTTDPVRAPTTRPATPQVSTPLTPAAPQAPQPQRMSQEQRRERNRAAMYGLDLGGRQRQEIAAGEANYDAAVLADELANNHFDALGNTGLAYSWQGGNANSGGQLVFKDRSGRTVQGTAEQRAAALADMDAWKDAYYAEIGQPVPASGGGQGGADSGQGVDGAASQSAIDAYIQRLLSGEGGPFTEEEVGRQTEAATNRRSADVGNANRNATLAAARGGVAGPALQALLAQNAREGRGGLAADVGQIKSDAVIKNHEAQMEGLQAGLQKLANDREYELGKARNANEAEDIKRRYEAAMADVNAKIKISANEISAQERMQAAAQGAAGGAASREQAFWRERFDAQNAREDDIYRRDLPTELLRLGLGSVGTAPRP